MSFPRYQFNLIYICQVNNVGGCMWTRELQFKVLIACYGVEENHVNDGAVRCQCGWMLAIGSTTTWWKSWLMEKNSLFLHDRWLKGGPVCNWFRRLFELTENRYVYVEDMCRLGLDGEGVGWRWLRRLYVWEVKQVVYCCSLLDKIWW